MAEPSRKVVELVMIQSQADERSEGEEVERGEEAVRR